MSETKLGDALTTEDELSRSSPANRTRAGAGTGLRGTVTRYGIWLVFGAAILTFALLQSERFLRWETFGSILSTAAIGVILATALTVPLVLGDFDLSIGAGAGLVGSIALVGQAQFGWTWWTAVLLSLAIGLLIGLYHGLTVAVIGASAFVVTLGTSAVLAGGEVWVTGNRQVFSGLDPTFTEIVRVKVLGIGLPVYLALVITFTLYVVVHRSVLGRRMQAIGDNPRAAELAGIRIPLIRTVAFCVTSLGGAVAGLLLFARAASTYPNAGTPFLLPAFAAVFLGVAVMGRGKFHILGSAMAVVLLQIVATGLLISQFPSWTARVFEGVVLTAGVLLTAKGRRRGGSI
jgi:ribose transport system permease protein